MVAPKSHPSDSSEQRNAEKVMLRELGQRLGYEVIGERVELGNGCFVNVDGINREKHFMCEVFSRIGKLQAAQVEKVASDILKLTLLERRLGGQWRKGMCFAADSAANVLRNKSWLATAAADAGIEVFVLPLPKDIHDAIISAQKRQTMVNKPSIDG